MSEIPEAGPIAAYKFHYTITVITVIAAIVMLVVYLRYNGFWIDELYTLHSIRLGWLEMALERLHRGHFPGYFALVRLWFAPWPPRLFEVALRSMSVFFYLLALASFCPLARRVLSGPSLPVAVALFACNETALRQASEARMYTLTLFIAVWLVRAWVELQQAGAARRWNWIMPVMAVTGFMVSPTIAVLLGSMVLAGFFSRKNNRRTFLIPVLSLAAGLAVFIPGAIIHVETAERLGISSSKPMVFLAHIVSLMPGVQVWDDYYQTDSRLVGLLIVGIMITATAIWLLWKNRRKLSPVMRQMALIVALPLVAITLSYPLVELFKLDIMGPPRYFLTLMPMAAILGGWALMQLPARRTIHAALSVFLLFSAWTILTVKSERFREQVTEYLLPQYQPGDGLVVTAHEIADGVEYYVPGAKVDAAISRWITDRNEIRRLLQPLNDRQTIWLVWYRGNKSPLTEVAKEMWGPFDSNKPDKPYGSLRLYKFTPKR